MLPQAQIIEDELFDELMQQAQQDELFDESMQSARIYCYGGWYEDAIAALNEALDTLDIGQEEQEAEVITELTFICNKLIALAREYCEDNLYENALGILELASENALQALELASVTKQEEEIAGIFYEIAVTYDDWRKYEQAIEWYKKFVENRPDSKEDALYNIASIYSERLKKYEKGAKYYKKYLKIRPDDPDASFHLGLCYENSGQSEDALRDYRKALDLQINSDISSNEKLIQYAQAILNIAPYDAKALYTLATVYQELKDDKAIQCYQKILEINPEAPEPHIGLGDIYTKSEEYEKAVEAYEKALKIKPDHADALVGLGIVSNTLGNYYEAMDCYEKACSSYKKGFVIKDDRILTALTELGIIYDNQNEIEKATESFSRAWAIGDSQSYIQFILKNKKYVNEQTIFLLITSASQKEREEEHLRIKLETEKRLFSDLKHTLGNILSTGPTLAEKVLSFLRQVTDKNYQDKKVRSNINYAVNLVSKFRLTNNLFDTFKFYAKGTQNLRREWAKDHGGEYNSTYLFALIFKHELTHMMFSQAFISQCKRLINSEDKDSLVKFRDSFLNDVLSLDINSENAYKVLDWMRIHLPVLNISIQENLSLNEGGIRFNFLFICFSELIYNALKYTDCRAPVQVRWKEENDHFVFSCRNTFDKYVPRSKKGLYFITQLSNTLGSDFKYKIERSDFIAEFDIPKKLFSEGAEG